MKYNIITGLKAKDPKRAFIFTAVDTLKKKADIQAFMEEYESWMKENARDAAKKNPIVTARTNVGYMLGYYDTKTRHKWYKILPNICHPIFGRNY